MNRYTQGGIRVDIIKDNFDRVKTKIKRELLPAGLEFGGMAIERQWKATARVDTGRYRSSIGHSQDMLSEKGKAQGITINPHDAIWNLTSGVAGIWLYIGTNVKYAPDLEARYGTGYGAMETMKPLVLQGIKKALEGGLTIL